MQVPLNLTCSPHSFLFDLCSDYGKLVLNCNLLIISLNFRFKT